MLSLGHTLQNKFLGMVGRLRYHAFDRHYTYTLQASIILTTILLTALAAIIINSRGMLGLAVVGAMAGLIVFVLVYNHTNKALFLIIVCSTILNPTLPRDLTTTLLLLLLVMGVWLIKLVLGERSFKSIRSAPPNIFIILFGVAVIIAYLWSTFYVDPVVKYLQDDKLLPRLLTGIVLIISPLTVLLFGNSLRSLASIKRLIWYFIVYGCVLVWFMVVRFPLPPNINIGGQLGVWVSMLALGQAFFNSHLRWWQRIALLCSVGMWVVYTLFLGVTWLSGWVPLLIGIGIIFALRSRLGLILTIIMVGMIIVSRWDRVEDIILAEQNESGDTRLSAGNATISIANDHFLFGTGPTGYYFYMTAYVGGLFQLSHNNYLDIYAQTGIVGFVIWILMWLSLGLTTWRVYRASPPHGFIRGLSVSLIATYLITLVLMMLGDWITPFTYTGTMAGISYTIWPWMLAGVTVALYHLLKSENYQRSESVEQTQPIKS